MHTPTCMHTDTHICTHKQMNRACLSIHANDQPNAHTRSCVTQPRNPQWNPSVSYTHSKEAQKKAYFCGNIRILWSDNTPKNHMGKYFTELWWWIVAKTGPFLSTSPPGEPMRRPSFVHCALTGKIFNMVWQKKKKIEQISCNRPKDHKWRRYWENYDMGA